MKKESVSRSAFFSSRALRGVLCTAAACSMLTLPLLAVLRSEGTANQRTLSFEERVSYQRAIEEVYWRHRIWPKERPDPKPPVDVVISQAQLEEKVADYLRKSQALEDYWQRPITAEQLQAEMDRMAKQSKQPEVLRELFEALGNDPFVIAECLGRPVLVECLVTNWYAYDQRIHGNVKRRAEAELQAHHSVEQMKELSGKYSEIEFTKSDSVRGGDSRAARSRVNLNSREWDENIRRLTAIYHSRQNGEISITQLQTGVLSPLQENEKCYYVVALIQKTKDHLRLASAAWPKEVFESWSARIENRILTAIAEPDDGYRLPTISDSATCTDDTWTATASSPDARFGHTALWTGSEMIVWGGYGPGGELNSGGRYSPSTDSWVPTSASNAPAPGDRYTAIWTGGEMIVWGGFQAGGEVNTGRRYNPITDHWTATNAVNAPAPRGGHTAVWTGGEMIVWGGYDSAGYLTTGGRYNPTVDSWAPTSTVSAPSGRADYTAVWTGSEMIVWGGNNGSFLNTGGRYTPGTDSWIATSIINAPDGRTNHTAIWTGAEMIVWGGYNGVSVFNTGGRYNPSIDSWTATSTTNAPSPRSQYTVVWTGTVMVVWGGHFYDGEDDHFFNTGGSYSPTANGWVTTSTTNAPSPRAQHSAVWTGNEMIVWGGGGEFSGPFATGGRYDLATDTWIATSPPSQGLDHTAIWTGTEMIVWGGTDGLYLNTGGRYTPVTDSWAPTTATNAPTGRYHHSAIWSGSEMIIWGGQDGAGYSSTGGRYNPSADSWIATATTNAPSGRAEHTAVWTGSEMIVWGGTNISPCCYLNTGGRYDPSADTWAPTSTINAPSPRTFPTAVWTGNEMIVWGGFNNGGLNTGGKYNPDIDSWLPTSTTNAPSAREEHTAVWTGDKMIVWGGIDNLGDRVNTGGRYNPNTDAWTATSTTNAPSRRFGQTAVWTGTENIVWGGDGDGAQWLNTGGRYNPGLNSWAPTSTTNAPSAREYHTAVWSGNEMIIWGGTGGNTGGRYCAQLGPTPTPTTTPTVTITPSPSATATPTVTPTATARATPRARPTPLPRPTPPRG